MLAITRAWRASIARSKNTLNVRPDRHRCPSRYVVSRAGLNFKIYSAEDCPLCDGLKDKLEALKQRSQFQEDFWTGMTIEVCQLESSDCTTVLQVSDCS